MHTTECGNCNSLLLKTRSPPLSFTACPHYYGCFHFSLLLWINQNAWSPWQLGSSSSWSSPQIVTNKQVSRQTKLNFFVCDCHPVKLTFFFFPRRSSAVTLKPFCGCLERIYFVFLSLRILFFLWGGGGGWSAWGPGEYAGRPVWIQFWSLRSRTTRMAPSFSTPWLSSVDCVVCVVWSSRSPSDHPKRVSRYM